MSEVDELSDDVAKARRGLEAFAKAFLQKSSAAIGQRATEKYMRRAGSATSRRNAGDKGPLRIVQGRLARSLTGSRFVGAGDESINRIEIVSEAVLRLVKGTKTPYAAAQEHGASFNVKVPVTDKMRRFFWFKHFQTGRDKWKGMALTKKDRFSIDVNIPKRAYLNPAFQDALPALREMGRDDLHKYMREAMGV